MRPMSRALAVAAFGALCAGCPGAAPSCPYDGGGEVLPMEIGLRTPEGTFRPLTDGEVGPIALGPEDLNMLVPSLRAEGIDPRAPDPDIHVEVAGYEMGNDIEGARVDMEWDGTGYVLWDLRVIFPTWPCCYMCRDGIVTARIQDRSGRCFEGSVHVHLQFRECPNLDACCTSADACPDPALTQLCM